MTQYTAAFYRDLDRTAAPSAERLVPRLIDLVAPKSVVDVGCGDGSWLLAFSRRGVEDVIGIDGPWIAPRLLKIAPERFRRMRLDEPVRLDRRFDLALSLEVAEHLPQGRAGVFVAELCALAPAVLFSAAIPGQGGEGHVNEQWPRYWAEHFRARGYLAIDHFRYATWNDPNVAWWYRQNLLLFCDAALCAAEPRLSGLAVGDPAAILPLVHPECFAGAQRAARPGLGRWLRMAGGAWRRSVARGPRETTER
ncbi:MAG: class I SAM-dependent methyltransferase [Alphaproteobacteria bacterium]